MDSGQIIATSHDLTPNGGLVREIPLFQGNLGWWNNIIWPDGFLAPPFTMAERKFRFIDFLDQAVCDLIGDGADSRKQQRVPISSAPSHWCDDLKEISKLLARWSDEQLLAKGCSARGHGRKKKQMSEMEKEHRSNLQQIVCYFRSVYEVLIDADERLSELLSPQDLLLHLRAMEHLEPLQLVPAIKYLVCWPIAKWLRQEMPEPPEGLAPEILRSPLKLFSKRPRTHLHNLAKSRTSEWRPLKVFWAWLQGVKRGMPQIPDAFILASKHKHARALQKVLPPMDEKDREEFQHEFKVLWRGVSSERTMCFRDEDGQLRKGQIRQWKADKAPREWQGNPGWNACTTSGRGNGGKTQAVRETIRDRIKDQLEAYANADPQNRSSKLCSHTYLWRLSQSGLQMILEVGHSRQRRRLFLNP